MKKSYFLSGLIAFGSIIGVNASEVRRPEIYSMLDVAVENLKNINWSAVFGIIDSMQGNISVNEYRSLWGETLLYMAAVNSASFIATKELLEKYHANPNLGKAGSKKFKETEETPLFALLARMAQRSVPVARKNDLTMVKLLLAYGANPYMGDKDGHDCFWQVGRIENSEPLLAKELLKILESYKKN